MGEFIPRSQLRDHLTAGWQLYSKMDYPPNEWAFYMWLGSRPTRADVDRIMEPYLERDERLSNRRQGAISGHPHAWSKKNG